jgi:hypothetical protein
VKVLIHYTYRNQEKEAIMHVVANVAIFLLGGMAIIIIMRLLLFHFWSRSNKRTMDDQYLKRIADSLH